MLGGLLKSSCNIWQANLLVIPGRFDRMFPMGPTGLLDQNDIASGSKSPDAQFVCYRALIAGLGNRSEFEERRAKFGIDDQIWKADRVRGFPKLQKEKRISKNLHESSFDWSGSWIPL